jgi:AcrR family transcriptional regulator
MTMFETTSTRGRLLAAALDLAAKKSWAEVTLRDIAEAAGLSLGELRTAFKTKSEVIGALLAAVDGELLRKAPLRSEGQQRRDQLFDIIMTRFDILAPYRRALRSIARAGTADLGLAAPFLSSQYWMLQAAGIATDGAVGALRVLGLAATYAAVFRVWLEDEDPGLARTMAALDRRLRRGERAATSLDHVLGVWERLAREGPRFVRSVLRGNPAASNGGGGGADAS